MLTGLVVCMQSSDTAELVEKLEDSQMTLGSMASNRYSAPFRDEVTAWIVKLSTVSEIVEQWLMVQNMWMYMEAVFSGGDIVKQLPQEAKRFQNIDKSFMKVRECCCCMSVGACMLLYVSGCMHVVLYGGCVQRRWRCEAPAPGGQALLEH